MTKILLIIFILTVSNAFSASKSTTYSLCSKSNEGKKQSIIIAMETLSERYCKELGARKAEQYSKVGWKCKGMDNQVLFSCEDKSAFSFAIYNGVKLDHLTFTNLEKHKSLVAYINPDSIQLCHEDKAELKEAGVQDAVCHKRQ